MTAKTQSGAATGPAIVEHVYAAFARGDVAAILDRLADDFECRANYGGRDLPWFGTFHGKAGMAEFLRLAGTELDFREFRPVSIAASGRDVAVRLRFDYVVRRTGRRAAYEEVHWWTFTPQGAAASVTLFPDTAAAAEAGRP